ncbi:hypothetical protein [Streptomyces sp. NPDC051636]|uniref:hypothetical protein n=1 Tax=Streptomyces sp. NPDC051636 TaxID=3365663 RepID=UPI0037B390F1
MAGQQISPEVALPFFRQRCSELQDETLLLRARSAELEQTVSTLEQEMKAAEERASEAEQQATGAEQRIALLVHQLDQLRQENEQLRAQPPAGQAPQPLSCVDPDALP